MYHILLRNFTSSQTLAKSNMKTMEEYNLINGYIINQLGKITKIQNVKNQPSYC